MTHMDTKLKWHVYLLHPHDDGSFGGRAHLHQIFRQQLFVW